MNRGGIGTEPDERAIAPLLTVRQMSVAVLLSQGYPDKQIAGKLDISVQRVAQIVGEIRARLQLSTELDARLLIATRFSQAA